MIRGEGDRLGGPVGRQHAVVVHVADQPSPAFPQTALAGRGDAPPSLGDEANPGQPTTTAPAPNDIRRVVLAAVRDHEHLPADLGRHHQRRDAGQGAIE